MSSKSTPVVLFLAILSLLAAACTSTGPTDAAGPDEASPATAEDFAPAQAIIESIDVRTNAGGEYEAVVSGFLTNDCSRIVDASVRLDEAVYRVAFETEKIEGSACSEAQVPFEEVVLLGAGDAGPGEYIVTGAAYETFAVEAADEAAAAEPVETEAAAEAEAGDTADSSSAGGTDEACEDVAEFVDDVTYQDGTQVAQGEVFTKTWRVLNAGTCTWGPGYTVVFFDGDEMSGVSAMDAFPVTAPGESADLSVQLTATDGTGPLVGNWQIANPEGNLVALDSGDAFAMWVSVVVGGGDTAGGVGGTSSGGQSGTTGGAGDLVAYGPDGTMCAKRNLGYDDQLLTMINSIRAQNGLGALAVNPMLDAAAWVHGMDMACNDFVDHTGSDGSTWFTRIQAQGYAYDNALENIFYGFGVLPSNAYNWWMGSDVHRGNILNPDMTEIGIAYVQNPQSTASYYTVVFAVP